MGSLEVTKNWFPLPQMFIFHFKVIARDSQSTLEGLVESSRIADERDVQLHRSGLNFI